MKTLAITGSLRGASINAALLRAAARVAVPPVSVGLFDGLGRLPLFNPDIESAPPAPPAPARALRDAVAAADALLIASPEYAHGISGAMKNALDWLVGDERFPGKPVAIVNAAPRAHHADDALREVLRTMSATIVDAASLTIPLLGTLITEEAMLASPPTVARIGQVLAALRNHVACARIDAPPQPRTD